MLFWTILRYVLCKLSITVKRIGVGNLVRYISTKAQKASYSMFYLNLFGANKVQI